MIHKLLRPYLKRKKGQLELSLERPIEPDRNHAQGGRSFYFFDFDDNVAHLPTPMYIFHKTNGEEIRLSTEDWSIHHSEVGSTGKYADYKLDFNESSGSYRRFRDEKHSFIHKLVGKKQSFIEDVAAALLGPEYLWKGPSWHCFYHAVYNKRPISIITARGHSRETIRAGISELVRKGYLPHEPNYLEIYPLNNLDVRRELGDYEFKASVPLLKKMAIHASVEKAFKAYGKNTFHRFGMSDDDPKNLALIYEAMRDLKLEYPQTSFFLINTSGKNFIKQEVFIDNAAANARAVENEQLNLFVAPSLD